MTTMTVNKETGSLKITFLIRKSFVGYFNYLYIYIYIYNKLKSALYKSDYIINSFLVLIF